MKALYTVLIGIGTLLAGLIFGFNMGKSDGFTEGYQVGYDLGYQSRDNEQSIKPYDQLISEIKEKEVLDIVQFVEVNSEVNRVDEGGLFRVDINHYLSGNIKNNSVASPIKDVKIRVDFVSTTGSVISSEVITVYKVIGPQQLVGFKERISPVQQTASFKYTVLEAVLN